MSAFSRRAKGFTAASIRWPHRPKNPFWASARRYSARQRHSSRSSRRASWSSLRWANRAFRVWSSASTTRRRVKSEGCDLTSGVAVASDMAGSSRAKVIGALNSRLGRADRSRFGGSEGPARFKAGVFNTYEPGLYWLNLAIARRFTTAVAERREGIFWSLCVAARRDLRKKTGDNSIELMVLQERIELSTSPYQGGAYD